MFLSHWLINQRELSKSNVDLLTQLGEQIVRLIKDPTSRERLLEYGATTVLEKLSTPLFWSQKCTTQFPIRGDGSGGTEATGQALKFLLFPLFEGNTDELSSFDERDLLGKGSFGTAFKKKKDDEWFAIKLIGSAMGPLEVKNELLYGAALKRDELVPLKSAFTRTVVNARGESTFYSYLMFPFADHGDLLTFLNKKANLSIADKAMLAVQLCKALSDLHALGIVHRDLKAENVLVFDSNEPIWRYRCRLSDYGLAHRQVTEVKSEVYGEKAHRGTLLYLSPEVYRYKEMLTRSEQRTATKPDLSPAQDIYALGMVLWEIFSGRDAFSAFGRNDDLVHQMKERSTDPKEYETMKEEKTRWFSWSTKEVQVPRFNPLPIDIEKCPPAWVNLMKMCWSLNPSDRPTAQSCLNFALCRILAALPLPDGEVESAATPASSS